MKPFSPHAPSPKQRYFLELDVEEAFFGGAAGGGKSDALLLSALQYVDVPGYSAGIFRKTTVDLLKPSAILDRAHQWFKGTSARWDSDLHGYRFPTRPGCADATIHFGFIQHDKERDKYQGAEFQFIGIDELGQWSEGNYRYLFSRLRRLKHSPVPIRMRGAGNPGGVGGPWVKARFIENARHPKAKTDVRDFLAKRKAKEPLPEPPVFVSPPSSEAVAIARELGREAQGAYFVPAFSSDNPGLDVPEYRMQLARLDPTTRAQLDDGDWDAIASGNYFQASWFAFADSAPAGLSWVRYWDLAATKQRADRQHDPDWSAGVKMAVEVLPDKSHRVWIADVARFREDPGQTERNVRAIAELDGKRVPIWMEEEPGSAGKNNVHNYKARILFGWQVYGHRKTGAKPEFWRPLSAVASGGNVTLVRAAWNSAFVEELCALPVGHDDQADSAGGALAILIGDDSIARARAMSNL